jgi:uncharacterized RDD family membrane protein YckC
MYEATSGFATQQYAGFGIRLGAYIIDAIIIGVIVGILTAIGRASGSDSLTGLSGGAGGLIGFFYLVYFWATTGQTPGKRVLGLRVVGRDDSTGGIGWGPAIIRWIGYLISGAVFLIGFLWIIWDNQKQGWHDKLAGTHVVRS